jgi:hypothetical protein
LANYREAARRLIPLGRGTVIFTGASGSLRGKPGYAQFAAAKAGLRMQRSVICRNNISAKNGALPVPGDAIVSLPGRDLA